MRYRISHVTSYEYERAVSVCYNQTRLTPCSNAQQTCIRSGFDIDPLPQAMRTHTDAFGNKVTYFEISRPHKKLTITALSEVEVSSLSQQDLFSQDLPWDRLKASLASDQDRQSTMIRDFCLPSPLVPPVPDVRDYALESFTAGRPVVEATHELMQRIYSDFTYDPTFTTISTPLQDVLKHRKGVCQDFSHLAIGCLRSIGLPARYVSGYIETLPAEGQEKLQGADASHAWFSLYVPGRGWIDFDPTNNMLAGDQHIMVAQGRDFADVTPVKGVIFGGGNHELAVAVDVRREVTNL